MNVNDRARLIAKATGYRLKHTRRILKHIRQILKADDLPNRVMVEAVEEQFGVPKEKATLIIRMARDDYKPALKNLYVIRLGDSEDGKSILDDRKFMEENLHRRGSGKPCVYVGQTGLEPEERFCQHKRGYKAGRGIAKKYGRCLLKEEYEHLNPVFALLATEEEQALALSLQRKGYAVWWG